MTLLLAFVVMLALVGAMAIGVIMGRKPIQGSCGGLAQVGVGGVCEVCGRTPDESCQSSDAAAPGAVNGADVIDATDATRNASPGAKTHPPRA